MPSNRAVGAARAMSLAALLLVVALCASLAPVGDVRAGADEPEVAVTETSWDTSCMNAPGGVVRWPGPRLGFATTAPIEASHGEPFEAVLTPLDQTFAVTVPPGWEQPPPRPWHDVTYRYQLSRNVEVEAAALVPGSGAGIEGEPSLVVEDVDGVTHVVVTVPTVPVDPEAPVGTIAFRAPAVELVLRPTGPAGSTIDLTFPTGLWPPPALAFREPVEDPSPGQPDEYRISCDARATPPGTGHRALAEVPIVEGPTDVVAAPQLDVQVPEDLHRGMEVDLAARTDAVGGTIRFWDDDVLLGEEPVDVYGAASLRATLPRPGARSLRAELHGAPGYADSASIAVVVDVPELALTSVGLRFGSPSPTSGATTSATVTLHVIGLPDEPVDDVEVLVDGRSVAVVPFDDQGEAEVPLVLWGTGYHEVEARYPGRPGQRPDSFDLLVVVRPAPFEPDDVPSDHPFVEEIGWLAGEGVTGGYPDGSFGPEAVVSRQAISAFLHRLLGQPRPGGTCAEAIFPDVPADHPFCPDIDWSAAEGLVAGYHDGRFRPDGLVSRQAFAAMLHRAAGSPGGACESAPFSDVAVDHPFCREIAWSVDEGIAAGYPDGSFRPGEPVTRGATAAFLARWAG